MKDDLKLISSLEFPSDRLSIGQLRSRFPDLFDQPVEHEKSFGLDFPFLHDVFGRGADIRTELDSLLDGERCVALNALMDAKGHKRDKSRETWLSADEEREELAKHYQMFGIAQGPEHARQLIRSLESAAAKLATGVSHP